MGYGIKIFSPGPRNDVTDHLVPLTEKRPRMPETGIKEVIEEILNTNFGLEYSVRKNRTAFSDVTLLQEIFRWNDPKSSVPFTFQSYFPETFCKWQTTIIALRATHSESEAFRARNEVPTKNKYRGGNCEPILVSSVP